MGIEARDFEDLGERQAHQVGERGEMRNEQGAMRVVESVQALDQLVARRLQARFGLPVHEVDERYSTTEALAAGQRGAATDAAAAAILLRQHLDERARAAA